MKTIDGKQIAYVHLNWNGVRFHIYVTTLGAQKEERIVEGRRPAWSPDGKEIAYITYTGDARRVTFIDIRTRKQKHLLPRKAAPWQNHPFWSAGGNKLAFSWNKHPLPRLLPGDRFPPGWIDSETIYIVNRDGTGLQQLLNETGPRAQYPVLSPDRREVIYTQEIKGRLQLFKLDMHSGIRTQLTRIGRVFEANFGGDWFDPALLPVLPQSRLISTVWGEVKKR